MTTFGQFYDFAQAWASQVLKTTSSRPLKASMAESKLYLQSNRWKVLTLLEWSPRFSERCLTQAELWLYGFILKAALFSQLSNLSEGGGGSIPSEPFDSLDQKERSLQLQQISILTEESNWLRYFQEVWPKIGFILTHVYWYYLDIMLQHNMSSQSSNWVMLPRFQAYWANHLLPLYKGDFSWAREIRPFHLGNPTILTFP